MRAEKENNILTSPLDLPVVPQVDLYSFVTRDWNDWLDRVALVDTSTQHQYTFKQALETIAEFASDLSRSGVRTGDMISFWCSNSPELAIAALASWKIGAVVAMIGSSLTSDEGKQQIIKVRSNYLFIGSNVREKATKAFGNLKVLFKFGDWEFIALKPRSDQIISADAPRKSTLDDTCLILFSSGTTGLPKAVELTQINMVTSLEIASGRSTGRFLPAGLVFLPMTHFYGLASVLKLVIDGTTTLIMPRFDLEEYVKLTSEHRLISMALVPPVAVMLTNHPELVSKYDLSSLMVVFSSGASLSLKTLQKLKEMLPGITLMIAQGYGMTETTGALTRTNENTPEGSVGCILPFLEAKFVDLESGKSCGPLQNGELVVRGLTVMKGYFDDRRATSEMIDADGWLHTGDIGYYDQDQSLYIVDRIKEMIKHKGQQVAPAELEALLLTHPEVSDVAVTGIPDEMMGELPTAFVVRRSNSRTTEQQIQKFVADRVAPYKQLTGGVRFVSSIPKSATGKILRRVLRDGLSKSRL